MASQNTTCPLVRKSHMSEIWDATITKKNLRSKDKVADWLYIRFKVPLGNFLLLQRRHHSRRRAANVGISLTLTYEQSFVVPRPCDTGPRILGSLQSNKLPTRNGSVPKTYLKLDSHKIQFRDIIKRPQSGQHGLFDDILEMAEEKMENAQNSLLITVNSFIT